MRLFYLLFVFCSGAVLNAQTINFPDVNFKMKLMESSIASNIAYNSADVKIKIDANGDGNIQVSEAQQVWKLDVSYTVYSTNIITSLVGIQYFTNLRSLNFGFCNVSNGVDVTALTHLEVLCGFYNSNLQSVNMTGLTMLKQVQFWNCGLSNIDVSNMPLLEFLDIHNNQITSINVQGLSYLHEFDCSSNQLTTLNVAGLTALFNLNCNNNFFTTLDFSSNTSLVYLKCISSTLTSLFIKNGAINIGGSDFQNTVLEYVCCDDWNISAVNTYYPSIDNVNSYCT